MMLPEGSNASVASSSLVQQEQEPDNEALSSALLMLSRANAQQPISQAIFTNTTTPFPFLENVNSGFNVASGVTVVPVTLRQDAITAQNTFEPASFFNALPIRSYNDALNATDKAPQSLLSNQLYQIHFHPPQEQSQQQRQQQQRTSAKATRAGRGQGGRSLFSKIGIDDLKKLFHLPIAEVARQFGTCTTALKKVCRKHGINRWPYRQIRSITKSIQSLEMASYNDTLSEDIRIQSRNQIVALQNSIDELIQDPNKVVSLVSIGLSEELIASATAGDGNDELDDMSNDGADVKIITANYRGRGGSSSSAAAPVVLDGKAVAADGTLNLSAWPKPSADVQKIMHAAAEERTKTLDNDSPHNNNQFTASVNARGQKRKFGSSLQQQQAATAQGNRITGATVGATSQSAATAGASTMGHLAVTDALFPRMVGSDNADPLLAAPTAAALSHGMNNLQHLKKVEIGDTIVTCNLSPESRRLQFSGPVQLAALQRKKLRPNVTRKVVPLMEPDIGSNFVMEFVPQFIMRSLYETLNEHKARADMDNRLLEGAAAILMAPHHSDSHRLDYLHDIGAATAVGDAASSAIDLDSHGGYHQDMNELHGQFANNAFIAHHTTNATAASVAVSGVGNASSASLLNGFQHLPLS